MFRALIIVYSPKENLLLAVEHTTPYWLPCPIFDGSVAIVQHGLAEQREEGTDDWGVRWASIDARSGPFPIEHPLKSVDQIDDYPMPGPDEKTLKGTLRHIEERDRFLVAGDNGWGLFERAWLLVGMNRLFRWSMTCPEAVERLVERIALVKIRLTELLIEEADVEMIMYGDDWGTEKGLFFSPEWWRRFIYPWQKRLYEAAKRRGVLVYQHSDGRVEQIIPDLLEIGVDILNIQRECNDWGRIYSEYGDRVTLWGGVSARTLDVGSPSDIAREVYECAEMGRDGGIVLAPGHALKYPRENIEAMRQAWLKYGFYRQV